MGLAVMDQRLEGFCRGTNYKIAKTGNIRFEREQWLFCPVHVQIAGCLGRSLNPDG